MKRILHVTFTMGIGGTESVIREIVNSCTQVKHEILCIDGSVGETGKVLSSLGIPVHCIARRNGIDILLLIKTIQLVKSRKIDVIHCHQYTPFFYGGFAGVISRTEFMFTEHGRHHPDKKRKKAWLFNKLLFSKSKANIAISEATKEALVEYEYCPPKKVSVIYNGISPESGPEHTLKSKNLVCIARFDKNKNQESIVKCIKDLKDDGVYKNIDFYGDGPELERVKTLADNLGVSDQCSFLGFIENPASVIGSYQALILASFTEGTSMVILEAFREQLPVIASKVGGTPELIENEVNGFLFDPYKIEELKNTILHLDSDKLEKISKTAKICFHTNYTSTVMSERYLNEYQK